MCCIWDHVRSFLSRLRIVSMIYELTLRFCHAEVGVVILVRHTQPGFLRVTFTSYFDVNVEIGGHFVTEDTLYMAT